MYSACSCVDDAFITMMNMAQHQKYPLAKKLVFGLPSIAMALLIFYFSSLERIDLPLDEISFNDLIFHFLAYFLFGLSLLLAAYPWSAKTPYPLSTIFILILIGVCYAASDEIHQGFVPNRTCSFIDFLADSVGVAASIVIGSRFVRKADRNRI
ncbi:hypothetical protein D3OALGB2SA_3544 [Olavius algarvensis associated proteobacterium Delta 3]|nr:hypothetical protein D3OALGB2SA_3544 [Olavius algarvensis associated proteobacterium Delta 3]